MSDHRALPESAFVGCAPAELLVRSVQLRAEEAGLAGVVGAPGLLVLVAGVVARLDLAVGFGLFGDVLEAV